MLSTPPPRGEGGQGGTNVGDNTSKTTALSIKKLMVEWPVAVTPVTLMVATLEL
jgi:hypothetical protein